MTRSAPTNAELERAIVSVPGVAEAHVSVVAETGKSRLRIRLTNDDDAESVSWAIAATLRERFGISLDPDQIRPRQLASPLTADAEDTSTDEAVPAPESPDAGEASEVSEEGNGGDVPAESEPEGDTPDVVPGEVTVSGDRVLLSEAARALLEEAVAESRRVSEEFEDLRYGWDVTPGSDEGGSDAPRTDASAVTDADGDVPTDSEDGHAEVSVVTRPEDTDATPPSHDMSRNGDDVASSDDRATQDDESGPGDGGLAADDAGVGDGAVSVDDAEPGDRTEADSRTGGARGGDREDPLEAVDLDAAVSEVVVAHGFVARDELTRARIRHLDTRVNVSNVSVTATLGFGDRVVTGESRSVPTEHGVLRAVAEATLKALTELTGERLVAGVDSVAASVSGEPPIATVIVSMVTGRGAETLLGSSLVRKDPERAVMRATLDALNRRVEPWLEVEIAG